MNRCGRWMSPYCIGLVLLCGSGLGDAVRAQSVPETALSRPKVSVGAAEGAADQMLFGAQQALRKAGGNLVVANFGTQEIREYDGRGRHVRTVGRRGDGPGEFRMLQRIGLLAGDSLAAYDIGLGRITIFAPGGTVARMASVKPFGNTVLPRSWGFTRGGGMLVSTAFDRVFRPGSARDTIHFAITNAEGVPVDTLGRYPGEATFVLATEGFAVRRKVAFGRDVFATARGDRLAIGSNDDFSFDVFFAGGRGRRTYLYQLPERRVTREEVGRANTAWLENQSERTRDALATQIGAFPHGETWPAFGGVVAAEDGRIWVQYYSPDVNGGTRWTVFGADGTVQRTVRSSMVMRVVDAGADWVLGWTRDAMGVERILLFDL